MEPGFFGQEARQEAEAWSKMNAAAEADGAGEDYGGVGKDLDKDFGDLGVASGTLVPDGAADRRRPTRANHRQTTLVAWPLPSQEIIVLGHC